ncbi:MAG: hypothetical protein ACE5DX_05030 [Candidatus Dojkabacteria bacterium]
MPGTTILQPSTLEVQTHSTRVELSNHTPISYQIYKDHEHLNAGTITPVGLENQVETFLRERAFLALDDFELQIGSDGIIYSPDFPGLPVTDLYARESGDPIYDLRAPYDSAYMQTIQEWSAASENDFSWIRFSPTTGVMSRETKIELGRTDGDSLQVIVLTIPFRKNQTRESAFNEIRELTTAFTDRFYDAQSELELLAVPVILERTDISGLYTEEDEVKRDLVVKHIDRILSRISGVQYYMGRPLGEFRVRDQQQFIEILSRLRTDGIVQKYLDSLSGDNPSEQEEAFNSVVNNFDLLWRERGNESPDTSTVMHLSHRPHMPEHVANGCGGYGGRARDIIASGINLTERKGVLGAGYPDDFGSPHLGSCGGPGNQNGGCRSLTIVGGCELCLDCHYKYASD